MMKNDRVLTALLATVGRRCGGAGVDEITRAARLIAQSPWKTWGVPRRKASKTGCS